LHFVFYMKIWQVISWNVLIVFIVFSSVQSSTLLEILIFIYVKILFVSCFMLVLLYPDSGDWFILKYQSNIY